MIRFSTHALRRYRQRRGAAWLDEEMALASYQEGRNISRDEAGDLLGKPIIRQPQDRCYRADAAGLGVWVVRWSPGRQPVVVTYLTPWVTETAAGRLAIGL